MAVCILLTACSANNGSISIPQDNDNEKCSYDFRSEFKNGFSFVREQAVGDLQLGCSATTSYYLFPDIDSGTTETEAVKIIEEESRTGYKFIDEDGNILFDNLDADIVAYLNPPTMTEPVGEYYVIFSPSYFTDFGIASVTRDKKFGIINTTGNIICDFIYDNIEIYDENTAIIKVDGMKKFYYINTGQESSFAATHIHPLKDGFFSFYTHGSMYGESTVSGVVDSGGNVILPDYYLYTLEEHGSTLEVNDERVYVCPPDVFFDKNLVRVP